MRTKIDNFMWHGKSFYTRDGKTYNIWKFNPKIYCFDFTLNQQNYNINKF